MANLNKKNCKVCQYNTLATNQCENKSKQKQALGILIVIKHSVSE